MEWTVHTVTPKVLWTNMVQSSSAKRTMEWEGSLEYPFKGVWDAKDKKLIMTSTQHHVVWQLYPNLGSSEAKAVDSTILAGKWNEEGAQDGDCLIKASFYCPMAIVLHPSTRRVFVSEQARTSGLRCIDLDKSLVSTIVFDEEEGAGAWIIALTYSHLEDALYIVREHAHQTKCIPIDKKAGEHWLVPTDSIQHHQATDGRIVQDAQTGIIWCIRFQDDAYQSAQSLVRFPVGTALPNREKILIRKQPAWDTWQMQGPNEMCSDPRGALWTSYTTWTGHLCGKDPLVKIDLDASKCLELCDAETGLYLCGRVLACDTDGNVYAQLFNSGQDGSLDGIKIVALPRAAPSVSSVLDELTNCLSAVLMGPVVLIPRPLVSLIAQYTLLASLFWH